LSKEGLISCKVGASRNGVEADVSEREEQGEMIRVTVEVREGAVSRRVRVTAPSIERALELAGSGQPGKRKVRVLFPIDPEAFFAGDAEAWSSGLTEAA
jgi:hypothetical protein